jgi:hypothetical protein
MSIHLTGKTRYRSTWRGKIILQVQEEIKYHATPLMLDYNDRPSVPGRWVRWRDAETTDLTQLHNMSTTDETT